MIPRVAQRGHSFAGAGAYYLHDKKADTSERVAWTYTHNLPTMDANKGIRYMAYTAKNADYLKHQSDEVSNVGRKATAGSVYSFSLSWHPEQDPHKSTMQNEALKVLAQLGLADHEAVIVAHNDEPHPHVHVISNLVHPETGRTAVVSYDYLTTSRLAEERERKDGKIYCEERVINNEKRRNQSNENNKLKLVKHREEKLTMAQQIQALYERSDNGKAFQSALQDTGYTLAEGDRRGFVLVNNDGEIFSLSRQLKGQRAKDIKARLDGLVWLPQANEISENRKYFMRDDHEAKLQMKIVDDAIKHENKKTMKDQSSTTSTTPNAALVYDETHLNKLDALRAWEQKADRMRDKLEAQLKEDYKYEEIAEKIQGLQDSINRIEKSLLPSAKRVNELIELSSLYKRNLANVNQRMNERRSVLEKEVQSLHPNKEDKTQANHNMTNESKPKNHNRGHNLDR